MYCFNCGKEIPIGGSFCPSCGMAQNAVPPISHQNEIRKKNKWGLIIVLFAALITIVAILVIWFLKKDEPDSEANSAVSVHEIMKNDNAEETYSRYAIRGVEGDIGHFCYEYKDIDIDGDGLKDSINKNRIDDGQYNYLISFGDGKEIGTPSIDTVDQLIELYDINRDGMDEILIASYEGYGCLKSYMLWVSDDGEYSYYSDKSISNLIPEDVTKKHSFNGVELSDDGLIIMTGYEAPQDPGVIIVEDKKGILKYKGYYTEKAETYFNYEVIEEETNQIQEDTKKVKEEPKIDKEAEIRAFEKKMDGICLELESYFANSQYDLLTKWLKDNASDVKAEMVKAGLSKHLYVSHATSTCYSGLYFKDSRLFFYYGNYDQDDRRSGFGSWLGYMERGYICDYGNWESDEPNGYQEQYVYYRDGGITKCLQYVGYAKSGVWNGNVELVDLEDNLSYDMNFINGKPEVIKIDQSSEWPYIISWYDDGYNQRWYGLEKEPMDRFGVAGYAKESLNHKGKVYF